MKNSNLLNRLWTDSHEKQSPQRFARYAVMLLMLLTLGVGQMWGDGRTFDGTEKLYITNCKPYYRENNQDKTWGSEFTNSNARIYAYIFNDTEGTNTTVEVSLSSNVYSGTDRTEGCIYAITVPSGTWEKMILVRASSDGWSSSNWETNKWNVTGNITISTTHNLITHFKIDDSYCEWGYVPMTVSANNPVYIYYDNSNTAWDDYIQFMVGHSGWGRAYPLNKLAGTNLAYRNLQDVYNGAWTDATYYAIAQKNTYLTNSDGTSNYDYSSVTSNATNYTAAYRNRSAFTLSANNSFLCTTSSGSNGTDWDITYLGGGYSDLNHSQTIYKSLDGEVSTANVGTVTITTTKLTGNVAGAQNNSTATIGSSSSNTSTDAVITATVTLSASANDGYTFDYWATTANGSDAGNSYTANSTNTRYARFHSNTYDVTLDPDNGNSTSTVTATYNQAMPSKYKNSETSISAPSFSPLVFGGYYDGHGGSGTQYYSSSPSSAHVYDKTSTATLYAKWTLDITLDDNGGTEDGSATVTYKGSTVSNHMKPTYAGKVLQGYYTDASGGDMVMTAAGALEANVDGYTDASGNWIKTTATTLHAHWADHTWALYRNTGATKLGDLTVRGSDVYTLNLNIVNGTNNENWNFKMDGTTTYHYGAENPIGTARQLTSGAGQLNWQGDAYGWYTIKVYYSSSNWYYIAYASPQVSFTASPTGGTVSASAQLEGSLSSDDYITYDTYVTFTATPSPGYTFEGWYGASDFSGGRLSTDNPLTVSNITSSTARYAKFTETMHTITIEGGSSSSTTAGIATTGSATANAPATGKKFTGWDLGDGVTLSGGCMETDRTITFTASKAATVTATYDDRASVKLYFASPGGWDNIYAYAWKEGGTSNASFPGVEITSNTEVVDCATYYVYQYYTEADGIGNAATGSDTWDNVIFGNGTNPGIEYPTASWTKTHTLTITSGNFYRAYEDTNSTGRSTGNDWYVKGNFGNAGWVNFSYPIELNCATSTGYVDIDMSISYTHYFQILQASTNKIFRISTADSDAEVSIGTEYTLYEKSSNADKCTNPSTTTYRFTLNVSTPSAPVLTVRPAADNDYTVTFAVSGHGSISTPGTGSQTIHQYAPTTITAVADPGYRFTGWTVDSDHSSYVTIASSSSATTTVTGVSGAAGATITANFSNEGFIYLDKSAIRSKWPGTPYVYFYTAAYWNNDAGTGSKTSSSEGVPGTCIDEPHAMTQIGSSDIWYYDYSSTPGSSNTKQYVAFTDKSMPSYNWFSSCQAIYRGDFYPNMPMLVIRDYETKKNNNTVAYYQQGYWRKYNDTDPGYVVKIYNGYGSATCTGTYAFSSTEAGSNNCTADVPLNSGNNYFKVVGCDTTTINSVAYAGTYYRDGSNGTMNTDNCTNWLLTDESGSNTGVQATASGDYTFTLTLGAGQLYISVDFPLAVGDFRLVYNGKMRTSYVAKKNHPSNYIRKLKAPTVASDTTRRDTISFFVDPATGDLAPDIRFQWCSAINGYDITWRDTLSTAKPSLTGITKAGVYDFIVTQNTTQAGVHTISCELMGAYTGDYYIRTDVASGGWKTYKETEDNKLSYSSYSKAHSGYDYYHCHWTPTSKNVKFTIASDYSECVSDTVENDDFVTSSGTLPYEASVRFMFNDSTNELWRAYLNGSNEGEAEYLKIQALNDSIMDTDGVAFTDTPTNHHDGDTVFVKFEDLGNWVYQYDLKAKQGTHYRLVSDYYFSSTHHLQYFKGTSGAAWNPTTTDQLVGGTGNTPQKLRLVYDYKTNNLTAAWMPDGEQSADLAIYADMMLIRRAQNAATQLTFATGKKLSNVQTMIGAVEFFKDSIVGRVSNFNGDVIGSGGNRANRELMLYISFPFDVAVNDIYGIGQLNKEWYLQYYDGAERASKGFFRGDGTTTFWKYMTLSDTLRANVGYSLLLDNDYFNTDNYGVWKNISDGKSVYLFFPSAKELSGDSIIASATKTIRVPEHKHTSGRTFEVESRTLCHDFTDSDWNMMGVPLFQNQTGLDAYFDATADPSDWPDDGKGYFYEWDSIGNNFEIHTAAGYTFKSMHGYMVQYSGEVSFTGASIQPASSVVARRAQKSRENYTMELQLLKENKRVSRTYIELREEACDTFALDEDVYMVYTSHPADLYTYAGNYDVSANVLSMDNHSIPVGIEVHKAGSYTFSMPSSFNGAAILIDTQTGARTNLALSDYIVTLPRGICDGRFYIEIDLNKMPTAIDGVEGGSLKDGKAHKFIENGAMYILQDGKIYDARGNRLQ